MELNSFQLKWIAIITMVIDHVGAVLFPYHMAFRVIGRIAFPIFCFLLVEGFFHTRDICRYLMRLGAFAVFSEIPYDLAFHGSVLEFGGQNVFFTLFLGVLLMYLMEKNRNVPVRIVYVLLTMWAASVLHTDYSYRGILLILIYYLLNDRKELKVSAGAAWNIFLYMDIRNLMQIPVQYFGAFASVPIALYNGERGPKIKYFFYLFYPCHLLVLYICKLYIFPGIL